jgi:hypothetical protein
MTRRDGQFSLPQQDHIDRGQTFHLLSDTPPELRSLLHTFRQGDTLQDRAKESPDLNRDVLPIRSVMWRQIGLICVPQLMRVGGSLATLNGGDARQAHRGPRIRSVVDQLGGPVPVGMGFGAAASRTLCASVASSRA